MRHPHNLPQDISRRRHRGDAEEDTGNRDPDGSRGGNESREGSVRDLTALGIVSLGLLVRLRLEKENLGWEARDSHLRSRVRLVCWDGLALRALS